MSKEEMTIHHQELFSGVGVIVDIKDKENFLKIAETLARIGVPSKTAKRLYQSCHILHKRDNAGNPTYAIVHFKEMFKLDGKPSSLDKQDIARRNTVVKLLSDWNLIEVVDERVDYEYNSMSLIKVLAYSQKQNWELVEKYKVGNKSK